MGMNTLFNQKEIGQIYKQKIRSGFRDIGSLVKIINISGGIITIQHLPVNLDALLGDDVSYYGEDCFDKKYEQSI